LTRRRLTAAITGLAVAVLAATGLLLWQRRAGESSRPTPAPPADTATGIAARGEAHPLGPRDPASGAATAASGATPKRLDPAARQRLEQTLAAARARRTGSRPAAPSLEDTSLPTRLDLADKTGDTSEWEKRQVGLVGELLGECYDLARATQPALAGKVMLLFTVSAEPEIGGLVSEIRFDESGTTIADQGLRECMSESLYALELEPPPGGVQASRQVTLDLSPDP
jgi:hypothetical protein